MVKRYDAMLMLSDPPQETYKESMSGKYVPYDDYAKLEAERDALRGVLEEISHDEGRFGLSASDMRELAKQVLARTELAKVK